MKKVYECDYCIKTDKNPKAMHKHEKTCYMNPKVKDCGTCKNDEQIPYEQAWECKFGYDYQEEKTLPCEQWESDSKHKCES